MIVHVLTSISKIGFEIFPKLKGVMFEMNNEFSSYVRNHFDTTFTKPELWSQKMFQNYVGSNFFFPYLVIDPTIFVKPSAA